MATDIQAVIDTERLVLLLLQVLISRQHVLPTESFGATLKWVGHLKGSMKALHQERRWHRC